MRKVYIVHPSTTIDAKVESDAALQGCTEIVHDIPQALVRAGVSGVFPFVYTEPDDPTKAVSKATGSLLQAYLDNPSPTPAQTIQALKELIKAVRRAVRDL